MSSILGPLAGVALGGSMTWGLEAAKERRARSRETREYEQRLETRWDDKLAQVAGDFVSTTRSILHTARRLERVDDHIAAQRHLDGSHERLRALFSELGLVANRDGQQAARELLRLTYRVRTLGERDAPRAEQDQLHLEVLRAISKFQLPIRHQLRVPNPDAVLEEDDYLMNTSTPNLEP